MKRIKDNIAWWFKPWHYSVMRFVGTERSNCNDMVAFIASNRIKVISYSSMQVEKRVVSVLIYKTKFVADVRNN